MSVNRVYRNLFQGNARQGVLDVDVVVLAAEEYQATNGELYAPKIIRVPLDDARLSQQDQLRAVAAARSVARSLRANKRVLTTCWMGFNRSGLISSLALCMAYDMAPEDAIGYVRRARGAFAMSNQHFVRYVHRYASVRA